LAIGSPLKTGLVRDGVFELGVRDLALRRGFCAAERAKKSHRKQDFCEFHIRSEFV
jgi:hypothetical protein